MSDKRKGAADHTGPIVIGAQPYVCRDPLVECPMCADGALMGCEHCDDTGRVRPDRADALRRMKDARETPKVG
jgi:hypothetical protein